MSDWTKKQQNAYDKMVIEAKELYNSAQGSWVEFALYLWDIEDKGTWKNPNMKFNGFGDFLRAEFPAAWGNTRYQNVKKAIQVYSASFMRRVGIECAHAITIDSMVVNDDYVVELKNACEDHFGAHGVMPDINTIRDMVDRIARPPRAPSRLSAQRKQRQELQKENSLLKRSQTKAEKAIETHDVLVEKNATLKADLKDVRSKGKESREVILAENKQLKIELKAAKTRIRELEHELTKTQKALERERSGSVKKNGGARTSKKQPPVATA
jgi:hypothetical protein